MVQTKRKTSIVLLAVVICLALLLGLAQIVLNDTVTTLLAGKAAGYKALVESAGGNAQAAATLLMIEKLEEPSCLIAVLSIAKRSLIEVPGFFQRGAFAGTKITSALKARLAAWAILRWPL